MILSLDSATGHARDPDRQKRSMRMPHPSWTQCSSWPFARCPTTAPLVIGGNLIRRWVVSTVSITAAARSYGGTRHAHHRRTAILSHDSGRTLPIALDVCVLAVWIKRVHSLSEGVGVVGFAGRQSHTAGALAAPSDR